MSKDTLTITDNRTGKQYDVPISDGTIRAMDLRQIKVADDDFGLMTYDPAFMNTASCKSRITFIDGDKGILRYRGYPIEQLAERATFLEVAWLLRNGELPSQEQYNGWVHDITYHTYVHENIRAFLAGFRYDAHPMAMLCSTVAALSSFYPEAKNIADPQQRYVSIIRLLAKVPTLAAFCYRHGKGLPFVYPDNDLGYVENFLSMVARRPILRDRGRDRGAVRPAPRRSQRGRAPHDPGDRPPQEHPRLHRGREERQGAAVDGLRPPGLQELRPARQDR